ncbi:MAG: serine/threonine-protein kinase [Anaeromyxobacter sp.]
MPECATCGRDVGEASSCEACGAEIATAVPEPLPIVVPADRELGKTVGGKYRLDALIGRGGMGRVFRATDLTLDRPVAVKLLEVGLHGDPTMAKRFQREARAATRLSHPNSVAVLDFGRTDEGVPFLAMEYVAGRSLTRLLADEFPLSPERVVRIGAQILAAVGEAHAHGVLHCDLKPENVMIVSRRDERDAVKVLDFGVAKLAEGDPGASRLTQAGSVTGTPGYMSPEQARGEPLDARSDLYSVGVILYELVAGKLPFESETPIGMLTRMLVERPPRPSVRSPHIRVPVGLEALVMRALSVEREGRPQSAEAFREELLRCATSEVAATPSQVAPQATALFDQLPARAPAPTPGRTATATAAATTPRATARRAATAAAPARRDVAKALPALVGSTVGALAIGGALVFALTRVLATPEPAAPPPPAPAAGARAGVLAEGAPDALALPPGQSGEGILTVLAAAGAELSIDGRPAGAAPREFQLTSGPHDLTVTHPALGTARDTIQVLPGQRRTWQPALEPRK